MWVDFQNCESSSGLFKNKSTEGRSRVAQLICLDLRKDGEEHWQEEIARMPHWANYATIGMMMFLTCWTLSYAGAPQQMSIQRIVAEGSSIQRHHVTLQGVAHDMHALPSPSRRGYGTCVRTYGQATFSLDDGTGILTVEVIGSCGPPPGPLPQNGDEVRLTAIIHVLNTGLPLRLLAQTTSHIMILHHAPGVDSHGLEHSP